MTAQEVVTLIGNIVCAGMILTFTVGIIIGIRFLIQVNHQEKEEYERRKKSDELEYKEKELRYQRLFDDKG